MLGDVVLFWLYACWIGATTIPLGTMLGSSCSPCCRGCELCPISDIENELWAIIAGRDTIADGSDDTATKDESWLTQITFYPHPGSVPISRAYIWERIDYSDPGKTASDITLGQSVGLDGVFCGENGKWRLGGLVSDASTWVEGFGFVVTAREWSPGDLLNAPGNYITTDSNGCPSGFDWSALPAPTIEFTSRPVDGTPYSPALAMPQPAITFYILELP
jgi:hypothetical protein